MNEQITGNLYGMNIITNIHLPVDFSFTNNPIYGNEKVVTIQTSPSAYTNFYENNNSYKLYSQNDRNNILYKKNENDSTYVIETDKIGTLKVDKHHINYIPSSIYSNDINSNAFLLSFGIGTAMLLRLNNYIILHASALQMGNKTVLIMGQSGIGKTTLCSYLIKNHSAILISDDMSCIDTRCLKLFAGFPLMRLWSETIENIFSQDISQLTKVGKNGKLYFPIVNFTRKINHDIDAIVILKQSDKDTPTIQCLRTKELIFNLFKHIYNRPSLDTSLLSQEMSGIYHVIKYNNTVGFALYSPHTYESLKDLAALIINNLKEN